jgi:tetratricopeptide (TPR) repeat protein
MYVAPVKWLLFDPDGRRLLAGSVTSQTATVWHLPARTAPRPADEVIARVQAITGSEMDGNGTFHVLGAAAWTRRRAQVAAAQAGAGEAGQRDPAITAPPQTAREYHSLGLALHKKGSVDQAIDAYRKAIQLDPTYAPAYGSLGAALRAKRDPDGAIAAYREAVRHGVDSHPIYTTLTILLVERGEPREALGVLQRGAQVNPAWLADPTTFFRYNSACCACLTAAGSGKNVPPDERSALRRQALDWLTADLAAWRKRLAADPAKDRAAVHRAMSHRLTDADLATVRERAELEKLPLDERVGWVKLWTAVRELRVAAAPPEIAPPPRPVK